MRKSSLSHDQTNKQKTWGFTWVKNYYMRGPGTQQVKNLHYIFQNLWPLLWFTLQKDKNFLYSKNFSAGVIPPFKFYPATPNDCDSVISKHKSTNLHLFRFLLILNTQESVWKGLCFSFVGTFFSAQFITWPGCSGYTHTCPSARSCTRGSATHPLPGRKSRGHTHAAHLSLSWFAGKIQCHL